MPNVERLPMEIITSIRQKRQLIRLFHKKHSEYIKHQINKLQREINYSIARFRELQNANFINNLAANQIIIVIPPKILKTLSDKSGKGSRHALPNTIDDKPVTTNKGFIDIIYSKFKGKNWNRSTSLQRKILERNHKDFFQNKIRYRPFPEHHRS